MADLDPRLGAEILQADRETLRRFVFRLFEDGDVQVEVERARLRLAKADSRCLLLLARMSLQEAALAQLAAVQPMSEDEIIRRERAIVERNLEWSQLNRDYQDAFRAQAAAFVAFAEVSRKAALS